jgi:hypothetical protein
VKTETSVRAGSESSKIAGPTISMVASVVTITMIRLPKALRARSWAGPS